MNALWFVGPLILSQMFGLIEGPGEEAPIVLEGTSTYYGGGGGDGGLHGKRTATGELFEPWKQTCASRTLRLGTMVWVTDKLNDRSTWCRVNDRGPYGAVLNKTGEWAVMVKRKSGWHTRQRHKEGKKWVWEDWKNWGDIKPGKYKRVMDLSIGTARALGYAGTRPIQVRVLSTPKKSKPFLSFEVENTSMLEKW